MHHLMSRAESRVGALLSRLRVRLVTFGMDEITYARREKQALARRDDEPVAVRRRYREADRGPLPDSRCSCIAASWFARHSGQSAVTASSTLGAGLASTVLSSRRSLVRPAPLWAWTAAPRCFSSRAPAALVATMSGSSKERPPRSRSRAGHSTARSACRFSSTSRTWMQLSPNCTGPFDRADAQSSGTWTGRRCRFTRETPL